MSLARSLTSRMRARFEDVSGAAPMPSRAFSTKAAPPKTGEPIDRRLISLPVELISTSNSLAYEAPDIKDLIESNKTAPPASPRSPSHPPSQPLSPLVEQLKSPLLSSSSASSTRSWEEGLASPALTSASSVTSNECSREPSPANCDPNAMSSSSFFLEKAQELKEEQEEEKKEEKAEDGSRGADERRTRYRRKKSEAGEAGKPAAEAAAAPAAAEPEKAPEIPKRSATHTKQTHQMLARERSRSRHSSPRHSALEHPFGAELAKVNELAEEFCGGEVRIVDEETQHMLDHGFRCFGASDYIAEIQPLFARAFGEPALPVIAEWI